MSKLRSGRTFEYKLESEREDSEADVFSIRVLSGEQDDTVSELAKQYVSTPDKAAKQNIFEQLLTATVASCPWAGTLRSVLTDRECWELIGAAREGAALTVDERKKFVLPSKSETD